MENLKQVTTRVTLPNGRVVREENGSVVELGQTFGFVIDNTPDLQVGKVEEKILVASQDVANDLDLITQYGITHILNVANFPSKQWPELQYLDVPILDLPEEQLSSYFPVCFKFIDNALETGCILVHCNAGISRSVSIVVAYLMSRHQLNLDEALSRVKAARPKAQPNKGFLEQLKLYEKTVASSTT